MKTAILTFYEAYPPTSGAAIVSYSLARYLPGERLLVQIGGRGGREEPQPGLTVLSLDLPAQSPVQKITRLPERIRALVSAVSAFGPGLVILEGASWAIYHRLLLSALRRRLPGVRVVHHAHNVEYDLRRTRSGRGIAALTRWAERGLMHGSDLALAVSEVDAARFQALYGQRPGLLPNGVDLARFGAATPDQVEALRSRHGLGPHVVLFMGLYAYPPNTEAVRFLVQSVMPLLLRSHPDAQLVVTGGEVPLRRPWLINPGVLPFEEVPAMLRACGLGTAPIFSGSGTRLKILESMAAGVPVVATPKGAEGLAVADGVSILLAEDPEGFACQIRRLWEAPDLGEALADNARQLICLRYDWPVCLRGLLTG